MEKSGGLLFDIARCATLLVTTQMDAPFRLCRKGFQAQKCSFCTMTQTRDTTGLCRGRVKVGHSHLCWFADKDRTHAPRVLPLQRALSAATDAIDSQLFTRCDPLEIRGGQFTQVTDCQMCPLQRKDAWGGGRMCDVAEDGGRGRSIISEGQVLPAPDPPTNLNLNLNYEKLRSFILQNLCHIK